jgi:hypothetical protein
LVKPSLLEQIDMKFLLLIASLLLCVSPSMAQIYNCDGRWTNLPCDGNVVAEMHEHRVAIEEAQETANKAHDRIDAAEDKIEEVEKELDKPLDPRCPRGGTFYKIRPEPESTWNVETDERGTATYSRITVSGTVSGHGEVCATVRGDGKNLASEKFKLADDGDSRKFRFSFEMKKGLQWAMSLENCGSFRGFCGPVGLLTGH